MSHINYNHLYYFWHVYKEGSVVGAAEALYLTPQTITGQIRALEERLQGKLFKRKGRGLEPSDLEERRLLIPGRRSMLGRKLLNWFNSQGLNVEILGEFDDAALMKAFGAMHNAIFVAPTLYAYDFYADKTVVEIGRVENVMEEYHAIFAERMIQHPAVQRICNTDYSALFSPAAR